MYIIMLKTFCFLGYLKIRFNLLENNIIIIYLYEKYKYNLKNEFFKKKT